MESVGKVRPGLPIQLLTGSAWIRCVATIVAWPIRDWLDERLQAIHLMTSCDSEQFTHQVYDRDVLRFLTGRDIVDPSVIPALHDAENPTGVVLDVDPIAPLASVSVDGESLTSEGVSDRQRDQFLRELMGAVVV